MENKEVWYCVCGITRKLLLLMTQTLIIAKIHGN